MKENFLILGASSNPERVSHLAISRLNRAGHKTLLVHPTEKFILDQSVFSSPEEITESVDWITVYVKPSILLGLKQSLLELDPKGIIFNPGTEDAALEEFFHSQGVHVVRACTLVLLSTNQMEATLATARARV